MSLTVVSVNSPVDAGCLEEEMLSGRTFCWAGSDYRSFWCGVRCWASWVMVFVGTW